MEGAGALASQADAILCAALVMVGRELAAHAGLPHRYVALSAGMLRSDEYSSPFFPWQGLPRWANRLTWWANDSLANLSFLKETNRLRARLGFRPTNDSWRNVLGEEVIVASEPSLGRVPADARVRTHQTGAWILPEREALPEEVERFLQAGPPPVYIGFGSMQGNDRGRGARAISEALRATGLRAVVSRGWEGLVVDGGPQVLAVDALPHGKLFPRCAAVVHHGGAGTTTAVARAGVPQVVVPHIADQYYQAVNVVRAGLSPATLPRNKLRAGPLAKALRACVEDGALRERARTFAQGMIQYGLAQAVQLVEMLPGTSPPVL